MEEQLQKLGLTKSEAKIYLELIRKKHLLAGIISKNTTLNRRTIYDSLERLEQKGLVGHNITANKKMFFAMPPETILKNIENMEDSAKKIIPEIKKLKKEGEETSAVIYQGKKGIRNILNMILKNKEYVSFGSAEQFPEIMQHDYEFFQNQKTKLKIKTKTILSSKLKGEKILKTAPTNKFKFLSEKLTSPSSTFIFGNKIAIIIWEKPFLGILIENQKVADSYKQYFNELWKTAKP